MDHGFLFVLYKKKTKKTIIYCFSLFKYTRYYFIFKKDTSSSDPDLLGEPSLKVKHLLTGSRWSLSSCS